MKVDGWATAMGLLALAMLLVSAPAVSATLEDRLRQCAAIGDAGQRLACYDALGRELSGKGGQITQPAAEAPAPAAAAPSASSAPSAAAAAAVAAGAAGAGSASTPVPAPPAAQDSAPSDETFGGYQFKDPDKDPDEEAMTSRVVQCQRDRSSGSWYFRLENDQVWKQVDRRTLQFRDCDFPVKVVADGFGYVMLIEGRDGRIRVSRHQ